MKRVYVVKLLINMSTENHVFSCVYASGTAGLSGASVRWMDTRENLQL